MKRYWVTTALTYANGGLHLGHLVEQIQADVWVRFLKLQGHKVTFVSGADAHGTPIMLKAEQEGLKPEELVLRVREEHIDVIQQFHIEFDHYDTTHTQENERWVTWVYDQLVSNNLIKQQWVSQAFDPEKKMFLPDRYVKGTCPICGAKDQYGDNCDVCGASYGPRDLLDAYSTVTGKPIEYQDTEHFFFKVSELEALVSQWIASANMPQGVKQKLSEWFDGGLRDWDVSRDEPYFGFKIPNSNQYFYVWLDAPVGYLAALSHVLGHDMVKQHMLDKEAPIELHHFIGKDIVFFHGVFWPALLMGSGMRPPHELSVHGFLTIDGQKMSKSRGTFVLAKDYLAEYDPELLRYYLASKLNQSVVDINLCWDDFKQKSNTDLVNKVINIGSRCASFVHKYFEGRLNASVEEALIMQLNQEADSVANCYVAKQSSEAMRLIMRLADEVNRYIDHNKPWSMIKQEGLSEEVHRVVSTGIQAFYQIMVMLSPVLPETAKRVFLCLNEEVTSWDGVYQRLEDRVIKPFGHLKTRI